MGIEVVLFVCLPIPSLFSPGRRLSYSILQVKKFVILSKYRAQSNIRIVYKKIKIVSVKPIISCENSQSRAKEGCPFNHMIEMGIHYANDFASTYFKNEKLSLSSTSPFPPKEF